MELLLSPFYVFGAVSFYLGLLSLAYYPLSLAYVVWEWRLLRKAGHYTPSVSILIPAYNEEKTIAATLTSALASDYPDFEIIVINDGSRDATRAAVQPFVDQHGVRYLEQSNQGKAVALNTGLAAAGGEIVLFTDADSVFLKDTLRKGVAYLANPKIGAVGGNDTPLHADNALQRMLVITSHIGTGFVRRALSLINVLPIIPGNLGLVRTEILRRIGGFAPLWGEDLELTWRLHREGVRVVYGARTCVVAECPADFHSLWKQRVRWIRSYVKVLRLHQRMIGNPRYGAFGFYLVLNSLNMIAVPLAQALGLLLLPTLMAVGRFGLDGLEWVAYLGLGFLLLAATWSLLLDRAWRDFRYLPYAALLAVVSYFYNAVVLFSLWAEWHAHEEHWNKLERRGATGTRRAGFAGVALVVALAAGLGYWAGRQQDSYLDSSLPVLTLAPQSGTTAIAIHFDAWQHWREAWRSLVKQPESRYINRVAVSAGRPDWTFFKWPGHEQWWAPVQKRTQADMLESTLVELQRRGYATTAILDVFAQRYIERFPDAASTDYEGHRNSAIVCSTELLNGNYGKMLVAAAEALAQHTHADTVALTELFYDKHCYDDRCLLDFRKATGRSEWPRDRGGRIDILHDDIGHWRSAQVATLVGRIADAVHRHGKKIAMDVKLSRNDIQRNSLENGQDYTKLAPLVDELVVWHYYGIGGDAPESSSHVAAWLDDELGPNKTYLSLGLWKTGWLDRIGIMPANELYRGLKAARLGGARQLWITPARDMSNAHWRALARWVREGEAQDQAERGAARSPAK